MGSWKCSKCGTITSGMIKPPAASCWKGGGHSWSKYGSEPIQWICAKCGATTSAPSKPVEARCVKGGNHTWRKRG